MILVDSSGWIEYFAGTRSGGVFAPAIEDTEELIVPTVCVYEVFKVMLARHGEDAAFLAASAMHRGHVVELSEELAVGASAVSVEHRLAMADSLIYATVLARDAELWTTDAHFRKLPRVRLVRA